MDQIGVLPDAAISSQAPYSQAVKKLGIHTLRELASYLYKMPYGYTEGSTILCALEENKGTCTHKHGIYAAVAQEHGIDIVKCNGFYKLTSKIVPGIQALLEEHHIDWVPAAHCFVRYGPYRVDFTEGNCNGKETPLDSYIAIYEIPFDFSKDAADEMYKEFLEKEFPRWHGKATEKTNFEWKNLYAECCKTLKLSVGCSLASR